MIELTTEGLDNIVSLFDNYDGSHGTIVHHHDGLIVDIGWSTAGTNTHPNPDNDGDENEQTNHASDPIPFVVRGGSEKFIVTPNDI